MKIAKDTVVSLNYELFDSTGELLERVDEQISYLHGGYDGIFPLVEEALHGKKAGDRCSVTMQPDDAFGEYDHSLVEVSYAAHFRKMSPSACNSKVHRKLRMMRISCSSPWWK
jgi:FKBP-type peptidyl-prolyl cis-trans isomerase SlyD